jgi:hypothetical protein
MVKNLLIITGGAFLLTYLPAQLFGWNYPYAWFGLQPRAVTYGLQVWRLVTYLFLHGGFFHVIFNLFALWMFGADLERLWGGKRFLFYYFLTGIGAGLLDVLLQPSALTMTVGCSGAIYGLLMAFGRRLQFGRALLETAGHEQGLLNRPRQAGLGVRLESRQKRREALGGWGGSLGVHSLHRSHCLTIRYGSSQESLRRLCPLTNGIASPIGAFPVNLWWKPPWP